eukprot:NODE_2336_length_717_cov_23.890719_g1891_i0.p1 GENE.NODE_2336_length_717_cov_23.890719_g1891_i0~~NODE_2336_length_717_cov_23.890719_g1891_i0.p1  ORF type:complete len:116 (+),score=10.96 NODE_2336_length_717_cov_23.890719_g1891_i0:50-397(+)
MYTEVYDTAPSRLQHILITRGSPTPPQHAISTTPSPPPGPPADLVRVPVQDPIAATEVCPMHPSMGLGAPTVGDSLRKSVDGPGSLVPSSNSVTYRSTDCDKTRFQQTLACTRAP